MCTAPSHLPLALAAAWQEPPCTSKTPQPPKKSWWHLKPWGPQGSAGNIGSYLSGEPVLRRNQETAFLIKAGEGNVLLHYCCPSAVMLLPGWTPPVFEQTHQKSRRSLACSTVSTCPSESRHCHPPKHFQGFNTCTAAHTCHLFLALCVSRAAGEGKWEQKTKH